MSALDDISLPLQPGQAYHIYNRGNEGRRIFFLNKNYSYFLDKYVQYMSAYWDTHAYCLLRNHFHVAVVLKSQEEILKAGLNDFKTVGRNFLRDHLPLAVHVDPALLPLERLIDPGFPAQFLNEEQCGNFRQALAVWMVSERFRHLLLGYAKAINKQEKRHGSLFQKPFRRKLIEPGFSKTLVAYIHRNPVHHAYGQDLSSYPWSSYQLLRTGQCPWLDQEKVMQHFGGEQAFVAYHQHKVEAWAETQRLMIEE